MMALPAEIQKILDEMEPVIRQAFLDAIDQITSRAQYQTVVGHLRDGNVEAAVAALRLDPLFFRPLDRALTETFYRGGVAALAALPKIPDPFQVEQRFSALMDAMTAPLPGQSNTSDD